MNWNITKLLSDPQAKKTPVASGVSRVLRSGGAALLVSTLYSPQGLATVLELSSLNGSNGFAVYGPAQADSTGLFLSDAGDVNDDGVSDLIIGSTSGTAYVVFGGDDVGGVGSINLSTLDGSNGFVLEGPSVSTTTVSSAGDVNGDGIDDVMIGQPQLNSNAGASFVVFGGGTVGTGGLVNLDSLDGSDGFVINGVPSFYSTNGSGFSLSDAGDINGDGVADLIIGTKYASIGLGEEPGPYVVFGASDIGGNGALELSSLDGSDGFVISGDRYDEAGYSVSGAGDVNGDNVADLIIGVPNAGRNSADEITATGETYVVFGESGIGSGGALSLLALNSSEGFMINGTDNNDRLGVSVSGAGDVNGDGFADLIIGADQAGPGLEGRSYVVFGGNNVGNLNPSSLDGSNGFVISETESTDGLGALVRLGKSVSGVGDVNGDGYADLIIGSLKANHDGIGSYVVLGGSNIASDGTLSLDSLNGLNGFAINGPDEYQLGRSVSGAGDINADGFADLVIGDPGDSTVESGAGASYVVFGKSQIFSCNGLAVTVFLGAGQTTTPGDDVILGTSGNDVIRGKAGNDTICGMGGDDYIHGNSGDDWIDGGEGIDNLRGGRGNDIIYTGPGGTVGDNARAFGGYDDDMIFGGPDADDLRGGKGDDLIMGGDGDDLITGNDDNDMIYGDNGNDTLKGGNGESDELFGGSGNDSLNGGNGASDFCDGGGEAGDTEANCEGAPPAD